MKRILLLILALLLFAAPASAMREIGYDDPIHPRLGTFNPYEPETAQFIALRISEGTPLTPTEIATIDGYVKSIKAGGTVTLSSLTAKFSTVLGTEFVTQLSSDIRWLSFLLAKLTWSDGTNSAVTYASATYGTGETYGSDVFAGWNFTSGWLTDAATIDNSNTYTTAGANGAVYTGGILTAKSLLKVVFAGSTSATGVKLSNYNNIYGTDYGSFGTRYYTVESVRLLIANKSAGTTTIASLLAQQVLTPSSTGLVLTNPTWGSFLPNAAAFNLSIVKRDI